MKSLRFRGSARPETCSAVRRCHAGSRQVISRHRRCLHADGVAAGAQRRRLPPGEANPFERGHAGLERLVLQQRGAERIEAFEQRYNTAAKPFDWRFNTDDLNQLLQRLKP